MGSGSYDRTIVSANPPTPRIDGSGRSNFSEMHQTLNRFLDRVACISQESLDSPEGQEQLLEAIRLLDEFIANTFGPAKLVYRR